MNISMNSVGKSPVAQTAKAPDTFEGLNPKTGKDSFLSAVRSAKADKGSALKPDIVKKDQEILSYDSPTKFKMSNRYEKQTNQPELKSSAFSFTTSSKFVTKAQGLQTYQILEGKADKVSSFASLQNNNTSGGIKTDLSSLAPERKNFNTPKVQPAATMGSFSSSNNTTPRNQISKSEGIKLYEEGRERDMTPEPSSSANKNGFLEMNQNPLNPESNGPSIFSTMA